MSSRLLFLALLCLAGSAHAQTSNKPIAKKTRISPSLSGGQPVRVIYSKSEWNKSPTRVDTATVIIRDRASGRIVQMQLNETTADSGIFAGQFTINWNSQNLEPEIYLPQNVTGKLEKGKGLPAESLIQLNKMKRMPFLMRPGETGEKLLEVFNNRDEATKALQTYKAAQYAKPKADENLTDSMLETAEQAKLKNVLVKIDFANGDVRHFMRHLAGALAADF